MMEVESLCAGRWIAPGRDATVLCDAATGAPVARAGGAALDTAAMLAHARSVGGPALRAAGFHDRAKMLKALAQHLGTVKEALYDLSYPTGATLADHRIDIDGGIGTLFVYASKGRRELPDGDVFLDGGTEALSRRGSFAGQHVCTPLRGVAVHINAFNFPVWGMLEKLAPAILAGVPVIVKPATATCYVTAAAVRGIHESGILPKGAVQMIAGGTGDLLDRLGGQDVVSFTGSAETGLRLRSHPALLRGAVRFVAEQDSLNAAILGPDAASGTPEFDLFADEVVREITAKAGQKCTAVRRILVPRTMQDDVIAALDARLAQVVVGDPRNPSVTMGALVSRTQRADVLEKITALMVEARRVTPERVDLVEGDAQRGAFVAPTLLHCADPDAAARVHDIEAFGPVATLMPYRDIDHAAALANRGGGSLVASCFTHDGAVARRLVMAAAAHHGRLYFNDRASASEATGHGSPLPHMVHGGPGRAGGGEELGGIRGVMHYMQRTAVQGSPDILSAITGTHVAGATPRPATVHPFRQPFEDLRIGTTLHAGPRTVTSDDIAHFAEFTGDTFYAHMDDAAAARNPFFPGRVAHGYLLLSFAAGLFVDPDEGPVLANTGLDGLRFMAPVVPGDSVSVALTVTRKTRRTDSYGEVRWRVALTNQYGAAVAEYELHTMNAYRGAR